MSSYDRSLLYQQFFGTERRDSIGPMNLDNELPFVTRESVRVAMERRNETAVWHTTDLNQSDIRRASAELERIVEKIRASDNRITGEFNPEPKPNKKTLSNPKFSLKEGTDDL